MNELEKITLTLPEIKNRQAFDAELLTSIVLTLQRQQQAIIDLRNKINLLLNDSREQC